MTDADILDIQKKIGYDFNNTTLLKQAFTSFCNGSFAAQAAELSGAGVYSCGGFNTPTLAS